MGIIILYAKVTIAMLARAMLYIYILRFVLRHISPIKSPFSLSKKFVTDTEKFGIVYIGSDVLIFFIERVFILGFKNALASRIIAVILSLTTSGFFGRFRTWLKNKILAHKGIKNNTIRDYISDTVPSFIFRVPIYIGKLLILSMFGLLGSKEIWTGILITIIAVFLFGRISCRLADIIEKKIIKRFFKSKINSKIN